jgi:hypothetical protein
MSRSALSCAQTRAWISQARAILVAVWLAMTSERMTVLLWEVSECRLESRVEFEDQVTRKM